jgi:hypothetical protein
MYVPTSESDGTITNSKGKIKYTFNVSPESFTAGVVNSIKTIADTNFYQGSNKLNCYFRLDDRVIAANEGAFIQSPSFSTPFSADGHSIFKIRVRNHSTSFKMKIGWLDTQTNSWDNNIQEFDIERNTIDFKEYVVDLSTNPNWNGKSIKQFKLYLAPQSIIGSSEIDFMAFGDRSDFNLTANEKIQDNTNYKTYFNSISNELQISGDDTSFEVRIFNSTGILIKSMNANENSKVIYAGNGLSNGIYYIQIIDKSGRIYIRKFIKY